MAVKNTVPAQLQTLRDCLLHDSWQPVSKGTWVHPLAPDLRLNTAYVYGEATVTLDSACKGTRERAVLAQYRGDRALTWCAENLPKVSEDLFAKVAALAEPMA